MRGRPIGVWVRSILRSLLREPLLYFLLIGVLLFAMDAWLRPAPVAGAGRLEILVSEGRIRNLAQGFRRTWQRPPTRAELDGLVQDYIREEVLYREAKALGLDQDDTVIRRRLRQKMEFVSDDAAALDSPSDQDLADWLAAHPDAFRVEPRATFAQIYLDPRRHGDRLEADAQTPARRAEPCSLLRGAIGAGRRTAVARTALRRRLPGRGGVGFSGRPLPMPCSSSRSGAGWGLSTLATAAI